MFLLLVDSALRWMPLCAQAALGRRGIIWLLSKSTGVCQLLGGSETGILRFGSYELEPQTCELRARGVIVRLQPQPCRVLTLLVSRAGRLVSREEIQHEIWGNQTFVDFEQGLNFCIRHIRSALGDTAGTPRFIETLPRRGYRFIAPVNGGPLPRREVPQAAEQAAAKIRLAVLPFENLSADSKYEYFADGMTDALITELTQISGLRVISRSSVMRFRGTHKPLSEVAQELNVEVVVEGAVLFVGDKVRVTSQLADAASDRYLWGESYERDLREILALQRKLARAITRGIRVKLTPGEQARLAAVPTVSPEVYQTYLKGRYHWNRRTEESLRKAVASFEKAIAMDPTYAPAYAGLADAYGMLAYYSHMPPREAFPRAKSAVRRALEIDDGASEAHTSLGYITQVYDWDWTEAEREYRRAIEINPGYATGHHWRATYFLMEGQFNEAIGEIRKAQELDPLSLIINTTVGSIRYCMREYDKTIEQCRKTIDLDESFPAPHSYMGRAYLQNSRFADAIREFSRALELSGRSPRYLEELAYGYAAAGRREEARQLLQEMMTLSATRYVSPYYISLVYVGLGDLEQAFRWLDRAIEERSAELIWLKVDPRLDTLRSDPRYDALLEQVRFT